MQSLFDSQDVLDITWSVGELTAYIRDLFDIDYRLQDVRVKGEISNFSKARSGHLYFTLKDETAQLKCVMWRSAASSVPFQLLDGDAVVASGRVSVYEAAGVYQLYVERIEPAGIGDLAAAFEQLKERLFLEGLFDAVHKKPLPRFPKKIGIVTSADAAALRDILNVLKRRWPLTSVFISPTLVQGKEAPPQIIDALQYVDGRSDIDLIIVARGGGSMEDLWAFNDENVARAIFTAKTPIIVGVGHEVDYTIADFVADVRAPTPSAAAELAVPDIEEIMAKIGGLAEDLAASFRQILRLRRLTLTSATRELRHLSPMSRIDQWRQRIDWSVGRIDQAIALNLERQNSRFRSVLGRLIAVDPNATLARGYAIVKDKNDRIVQSKEEVRAGDPLRIRVRDGEFGAVVRD